MLNLGAYPLLPQNLRQNSKEISHKHFNSIDYIVISVCAIHTHPFNGPFSGTTQVSRYQKGKINLDFTEARDSEWQWHPLGHMMSAPRSRQITTPAPHRSVFYRPDALPATQPAA